MSDCPGQAGDEENGVTPEMIDAGVVALQKTLPCALDMVRPDYKDHEAVIAVFDAMLRASSLRRPT